MQYSAAMRSPFDAPIHACRTTNSTMDDARRLARGGACHGTVVTAEMQTAGRGRIPGRVWTSAAGDALLCTIILNITQLPDAPAPSLIIGYGITEGVSRCCPTTGLQIKWPNDIFSDGRKLGGILCETVGTRYLLAGIGINVRNTPRGNDLRHPAACLSEHMPEAAAETVLQYVLDGVYAAIHTPTDAIRTGIEQRLLYKGQKMQWTKECENTPFAIGIFIGIDTRGEALLQTDDGICRIAAGELRPV